MVREGKCNIPEDHFGNIFWKSLQNRKPEENILIDAATKDSLKCGQLLQDSIKVAVILKKMGIQKGDVVSIVSNNNINCLVPTVASFYLGVTVNPVNPEFTIDEMRHSLKLSQPKLIISTEEGISTALDIKKELKSVVNILLMGPISNNSTINLTRLEDLISEIKNDINNFTPEKYDYTKVTALFVYSSGTTGLPKGLTLTHQSLQSPIWLLSHPELGNTTKDDVTVIVPPFYQIFGPVLQLLTLFTSMKSVIMKKFDPTLFLKCIEEYKATRLFLVPPLLLFLSKSPLVNRYDVSSVKDVFVGAAPVGKDLQIEASESLNDAAIRQIYGLSETCGPCSLQLDLAKVGSVGVFLPGIKSKVINPDTGLVVGPMEKGEICLKGHMLMKGYIPHQDFIDDDGFFHTGDIGYYDENNYFYIVDRSKEIIKYKGFQIAPVELENLILTHPSVADCGVIGIPNERSGEVPLAFVVLKKDVGINDSEIVNYVADRISIQKHLHGGVKIINEIPRNPSGKILRRKLVQIFREMQLQNGNYH